MRVFCLLTITFISATALGGVRERVYPSGREFFTYSPWPGYPSEARRRHQEGDGRFRLYIDKSGRVTAVKILQTTGYVLLDNAAVSAFQHYQARPGLRRETELPVSFVMTPHHHFPPKRPLVVREFTN